MTRDIQTQLFHDELVTILPAFQLQEKLPKMRMENQAEAKFEPMRILACLDEAENELFRIADTDECQRFHKDTQLTAIVLLLVQKFLLSSQRNVAIRDQISGGTTAF